MTKKHESPGSPPEMRYPCYGIRKSLEVAQHVKNQGGARSEVAKSSLARSLGLAVGPAFSQMIGAAKAFGMIAGFKSYKLTEEGKRYFHPVNDDDKRVALLAFFQSPLAFRALIEKFDGRKLPQTSMMGNMLLQDGAVPASWSNRVASIFVSSANELDLIDQSGILRYRAAANEATRTGDAQPITPPPPGPTYNETGPTVAQPAGGPTGSVPVEVSMDANCWIYREGAAVVRLETPSQLSRSLWERLQKYVEVLEPSSE